MVLHNPGNWHWVNKDARDWTKAYFDEKLVGISAEENGVKVAIEKVSSVEGDVDVSQRKGKVVTIFDVKVKLEYKGTNADGDETTGSITVPEVAHDTEEDEYQFEISNYADAKEKQAVRDLVRTKITPQLRTAFGKFMGDLMAEHAKDIQHDSANDPRNKANSAHIAAVSAASQTSAASSGSAKPAEVKHTKAHFVNTVTITETYEFNTSAENLYRVFVDPQMTTAFTRSPPEVFEPKEGGKFKLFGGNIDGEFKTLELNKRIVQSWRLSDWPQGHYSTLTLVFDQGTDSTNLRLRWAGVPVGQEEVTRRNFGEYYVKSIKTTFGFGAVL